MRADSWGPKARPQRDLHPHWAEVPWQETEPARLEEQEGHGRCMVQGHHTSAPYMVQGHRWVPLNCLGKDFGTRTTGGAPGKGEFITAAFGESNKIQKTKPEKQKLEAITKLRRSKQEKR